MNKEQSVKQKVAKIKNEYQQLMAPFASIDDLNSFITLFNAQKWTYQDFNKRKMDPESIEEGMISCSSAAALTAMWWLEKFPQLTPVFLLEDSRQTGSSRAGAHVNIALPMKQKLAVVEIVSAFVNGTKQKGGAFRTLDWTVKSGLKDANPRQNYPVVPLLGLDAYLTDRVLALGLPKRYSTKLRNALNPH